MERAGFMAHAQTALFQRRVASAEGLIAEALSDTRWPWSMAFSGGKDSTALLYLVRQQCPELPVFWFDDGWDYPETLQFLTETEARLSIHIVRACSPVTALFWRDVPYPGDDPAREHPSDADFWVVARKYAAFVGVRAQESSNRRMAARCSGPIHPSAPQPMVCWPLHNWTHEDIWAYIVSRGLPYNPVYDKLEALGVPLERRRVGPLTAWMVWQWGVLATMRAGWPDLYNRFVTALPIIQSYT
jgi:phosphoadenosine phosphosulfate reductase